MIRANLIVLSLAGMLAGCMTSSASPETPSKSTDTQAQQTGTDTAGSLAGSPDPRRPLVQRWGNTGYGGAAIRYPAYIHVLLGKRDPQGNLPVTYEYAQELQQQKDIALARDQILVSAIERASRIEPSGTPPEPVSKGELQAAIHGNATQTLPDRVIRAEDSAPAADYGNAITNKSMKYPNTGWAVFCQLGPNVASESEYQAMLDTGGAANPPAGISHGNCPHLNPSDAEVDRLLKRLCPADKPSAMHTFYRQLFEKADRSSAWYNADTDMLGQCL